VRPGRVAEHQLAEARRRGRSARDRARVAAVAEHADRVRDARHLVEPMRHVDDGDPALGKRGHEAEQRLHLVGRERRRRLVEQERPWPA
jgi:hypothetical protein